MVKTILLLLSFTIFTNASVFKEKCMSCHNEQSIPFEMIYKRYLIKYSSKSEIKKAIFIMCKNPSIEKSIVPRGFLRRFGVKKPCKISDSDLSIAIDDFINYYDILKKIKLKHFDNNF